MAVELVTGYSGTEHVSSSEDGARQAGTVGTGMYALETVEEPLAATLENANAVTVGPGDVLINGRHVQLTGSTTFAIPVGTQGQQTSNILAIRYSIDTSGVEKAEAVTLTGSPSSSAPTDPELATGSILDGDSPVDMPLYRVITTGIETSQPVKLFGTIPPIASIPGINGIIADDTDATDSTQFVVATTSESKLATKTGTRVWNWLVGKIRSVFGFSASNVLAVAHGGTGSADAANARKNLGVPPTSHAVNANTYGLGTGSVYGHVKLSDSTTSASGAGSSVAATPAAVKTVRDSLSQAASQTTLGTNRGITAYYRVWHKVVQCMVTGTLSSPLSGAITIGTLPAQYRPKTQINLVCNIHQNGQVTFFQVYPDGRVNMNVSNGEMPATSTCHCSTSWVV